MPQHPLSSNSQEDYVMPPARIWNKIEQILDQQEKQKSETKRNISKRKMAIASIGKENKFSLVSRASIFLLVFTHCI